MAGHSDAHGDHDDHHASHLKLYIGIGALLLLFTFITVGVAMFDLGAPGIDKADLILGLGIAAFKAALVALIFMHLSSEKKLIYKVLLFTLAFAISLFGLTLFAGLDPLVFESFYPDK